MKFSLLYFVLIHPWISVRGLLLFHFVAVHNTSTFLPSFVQNIALTIYSFTLCRNVIFHPSFIGYDYCVDITTLKLELLPTPHHPTPLFHVKEVVRGRSYLKSPKKRGSSNFSPKMTRFGKIVGDTASLVSYFTDGTAINRVSISYLSFSLHLLFLS